MVDSRCTRHIVKDASLFSSLNNVVEEKIFVVDDYHLLWLVVVGMNVEWGDHCCICRTKFEWKFVICTPANLE